MKTGFKDSVFGQIPDSWEVKLLNNITLEHKQGYYTKDEYSSHGVKLVRITDLKNPKVDFSEMPYLNISEKDFEFFKIKENDFLFARSGAIGRYGIVEKLNEPAIFASYIIRFQFDSKKTNNKFIGYFYESQLCVSQLKGISQGNANININAENIKSLKIVLPPLSEQQKIAEILSTVDEKIEVIEEKISKTQELKKGMMQQLFSIGAPTKIGSVTEKIVGGGTPSRDEVLYWNGNIPWATVKDLKKTRLSDTEDHITQEGLINSASNIIPADTLIIATRMALGKACFFTQDVAINQDLKAIFPSTSLNKRFLFYWIENNAVKLASLGSGSTVKGLRLEVLRNLEILLPSLEQQSKTANILTTLDDKLEVLLELKSKYNKLKSGLMQQLLTGNIRVNSLLQKEIMA